MKYTKENLGLIVSESRAISEVLRKLGLKQTGGNYSHISKKIKIYEINTSHFLGQSWNRGKRASNKFTKNDFIENVLIIGGSGWGSHQIKIKLFEFEIKKRKCEKCNQNEIWCNEKLGLELHHNNGDKNDNRLENLTILCPNCHSQTTSFSQGKVRGMKNKEITYNKKIKSDIRKLNNVCGCGKTIRTRSKMCKDCYRIKQRKVNRPSLKILQEEIKILGYCATGRKYGVSDNAIRKWLE